MALLQTAMKRENKKKNLNPATVTIEGKEDQNG